MDLELVRDFLSQNHHAVLATRRADGGVQQTPVLVTVDGEGKPIISTRETAYKVKNLRRDPWAQLCAFTDKFFGRWLYAEGTAEVITLQQGAMPLLIDFYRRIPVDEPDWELYRNRMHREKRVLIRMEIERFGPDRQG